MMMNYPTIKDIEEMQRERLARKEEQLREATDEKQRRLLENQIWMIQNS